MEDGFIEDGEGTPPRRPRRRAVRAAGPVSGSGASATPVLDKAPAEKVTFLDGVPVAHDSDQIAEPLAEPVAESTTTQPRRRGVALTALFVVAVLALVAAGVYLFLEIRASSADDARSERFVQTARQTVLNLTTIHPDSAQADVDRLLAGASGDFKAEFEGREGPFVEVVQQARVDSNGEIIEAGIESTADDYAEVLIAARAMVQNSDTEEAQPRDFRLRVRVVDDGGVMTASRVEFVP